MHTGLPTRNELKGTTIKQKFKLFGTGIKVPLKKHNQIMKKNLPVPQYLQTQKLVSLKPLPARS
jgi:hypothetical protein